MKWTRTATVVLLALMTAACGPTNTVVTGGSTTVAPPPSIAPLPSPAPPGKPPLSTVALPIRLQLDRLKALLEKAVPLGEDHLDRWKMLAEDKRAKYSWKREAFQTSLEGDLLKVRARATYKLEYAIRKKRPWPFKKGYIWIPLSVGMSRKAPRLELRLESRLRVEDWKLLSKTRLQVHLIDKPRLDGLGLDLTSYLDRILVGTLEKNAAKLDRKLAAKDLLRGPVEKAWLGLGRARPLGKDGKAWFRVRPRGLSLGPLRGNGQSLHVEARLAARPSIVLGPRPADEELTFPPPAAPETGSGFQLHTRLDLTASGLEEILARELKGHRLELPLVGAVRITRTSLVGSGDLLAFRVHLDGPIAGVLELRGHPHLDPEKGRLTVPDLDYALESRQWLTGLGEFMGHEALRAKIRKAARLDVRERLEEIRTRHSEALNRDLGPDLKLSGSFGSLEVTAVHAEQGGLRATLRTTGTARLEAR